MEAQHAHRAHRRLAERDRPEVAPATGQVQAPGTDLEGPFGDQQCVFEAMLVEVVAVDGHQHRELLGGQEVGVEQPLLGNRLAVLLCGRFDLGGNARRAGFVEVQDIIAKFQQFESTSHGPVPCNTTRLPNR